MIREQQIPRDLREKVDREIEPGEKIQWLDMPVPHYFNTKSSRTFRFGLGFIGFAIVWAAGTSAFLINSAFSEDGGMVTLFPYISIPLFLAGLAMLSSPLWTYKKSFRTVYVITERRALHVEGGRKTTISSYFPQHFGDVFLREKKNGSGDVFFVRQKEIDSDGDERFEDIGFLGVREPQTVETLLSNMARSYIKTDI